MYLLLLQISSPLIVVGIFYVFITIYRQYHLRKKSRSPFTDSALLRLPGHSIRQQILNLTDSINEYIAIMFLIAVMIGNYILYYVSYQGIEKAFSTILLFAITFVVIMLILLFKMTRNLNLRKKLNLGYEGELVTAQELNRLMPEGNYVYHDFPADSFNIDHVLVGPAGVFAIETKARSKKISDDHLKDAKATYNGKEIIFPDYNDTDYLAQAKRQAKWLSNWLNNSTGEPVEVFPIVSLPGWFVERKTGFDGTFVVNPKQLNGVIKSKTARKIDDKMVKRIVHQLDQKCRDIEIVSKLYDPK